MERSTQRRGALSKYKTTACTGSSLAVVDSGAVQAKTESEKL